MAEKLDICNYFETLEKRIRDLEAARSRRMYANAGTFDPIKQTGRPTNVKINFVPRHMFAIGCTIGFEGGLLIINLSGPIEKAGGDYFYAAFEQLGGEVS